MLLDRAERRYLAMCSREGGMDIETLAAERPDALAASRWILWSASTRPRPMRSSLRLGSMLQRSRVLQLLGTVYQKEDATLVEVNPGQDR